MPETIPSLPNNRPELLHYANDYALEIRPSLTKLLSQVELHIADGLSSKIYHMPSREFETPHRLTGISAHWSFPSGTTPQAIEAELALKPFTYINNLLIHNQIEPDPELTPAVQSAVQNIVQRMREEELPRLNERLDQLIDLNSELESLIVDRQDAAKVTMAIMGITSQYNRNDTQAFLNRDHDNYSDEYLKKKAKIEDRLGHMDWTAHPETLDSIYNQAGLSNPFKAAWIEIKNEVKNFWDARRQANTLTSLEVPQLILDTPMSSLLAPAASTSGRTITFRTEGYDVNGRPTLALLPDYHPTLVEQERIAEFNTVLDQLSYQTGQPIPAVTVVLDGMGTFYSHENEVGISTKDLLSREYNTDFGKFLLRHEIASHLAYRDDSHVTILMQVMSANTRLESLRGAIEARPQQVYNHIQTQWGSVDAFEQHLAEMSGEINKVTARIDLMQIENPRTLADHFSNNPQSRIALGATLESISHDTLNYLNSLDCQLTPPINRFALRDEQELPQAERGVLARLNETYLARHDNIGSTLPVFTWRFKTANEFFGDENSLRTSDNPARDIKAFAERVPADHINDPRDYHPQPIDRINRMEEVLVKINSGALPPLAAYSSQPPINSPNLFGARRRQDYSNIPSPDGEANSIRGNYPSKASPPFLDGKNSSQPVSVTVLRPTNKELAAKGAQFLALIEMSADEGGGPLRNNETAVFGTQAPPTADL